MKLLLVHILPHLNIHLHWKSSRILTRHMNSVIYFRLIIRAWLTLHLMVFKPLEKLNLTLGVILDHPQMLTEPH